MCIRDRRKASRIKTIHSSLALEGNRLSEHEVRDVLQGKTVVAPLREIQEVSPDKGRMPFVAVIDVLPDIESSQGAQRVPVVPLNLAEPEDEEEMEP